MMARVEVAFEKGNADVIEIWTRQNARLGLVCK